MRNLLALLSLAALVAGCSASAATSLPPVLPPPETFTWKSQPIEFSPPPAGWERQRANQGGLLGVYYVKSRSVGEMIEVAEYTKVDQRDRCVQIDALREALDDRYLRGLSMYHIKRKAHLKAFQTVEFWGTPIDQREALLTSAANENLRIARTAYRKDDFATARDHLDTARQHAGRIEYTLDDFIDEVIYKGDRHPDCTDVDVAEPVRGELAGEPAIWLDHSHRRRGRTYRGREVYVMHNNRLFVASFLGLAENLPLFDAIVETIAFPEGACRH